MKAGLDCVDRLHLASFCDHTDKLSGEVHIAFTIGVTDAGRRVNTSIYAGAASRSSATCHRSGDASDAKGVTSARLTGCMQQLDSTPSDRPAAFFRHLILQKRAYLRKVSRAAQARQCLARIGSFKRSVRIRTPRPDEQTTERLRRSIHPYTGTPTMRMVIHVRLTPMCRYLRRNE